MLCLQLLRIAQAAASCSGGCVVLYVMRLQKCMLDLGAQTYTDVVPALHSCANPTLSQTCRQVHLHQQVRHCNGTSSSAGLRALLHWSCTSGTQSVQDIVEGVPEACQGDEVVQWAATGAAMDKGHCADS